MYKNRTFHVSYPSLGIKNPEFHLSAREQREPHLSETVELLSGKVSWTCKVRATVWPSKIKFSYGTFTKISIQMELDDWQYVYDEIYVM